MYLCSRLQNARNVLCNAESRRKYDFWRRSGIAVPYEQWIELSGAVHTSLHWAAKPKKELMLDYRKGNSKILLWIEIPKFFHTTYGMRWAVQFEMTWGRGGGKPQKNKVGMCGLLPKTLTLLMTKIFDFPYLIYDLTKNLIPCSKNQYGWKTIPLIWGCTYLVPIAHTREKPRGSRVILPLALLIIDCKHSLFCENLRGRIQNK